jgi:predicted nucleic acid-binding protein
LIVSNTTPLTCLLKIGRADLLQALYGRIAIPPQVAMELDQAGALHADWRGRLDFVQIVESVADDPVMRLLAQEVDAGEAAAIALARYHDSELLIIDDMAGRRLARRLGLTMTGTVGVVLAAADVGLVDEPLDVLEELRAKGGLWLSDTFLDQLRSLLRAHH